MPHPSLRDHSSRIPGAFATGHAITGIYPFSFRGFLPAIADFVKAVTRDASTRAGNHASYLPARS